MFSTNLRYAPWFHMEYTDSSAPDSTILNCSLMSLKPSTQLDRERKPRQRCQLGSTCWSGTSEQAGPCRKTSCPSGKSETCCGPGPVRRGRRGHVARALASLGREVIFEKGDPAGWPPPLGHSRGPTPSHPSLLRPEFEKRRGGPCSNERTHRPLVPQEV